ncbi:ImmA/IrrE family metallo-endopeptidase [Amphiplicatus metriothermophilus]|uniref:Zn-dependent peptidase ImmA, M78 family n=1 Tax=Amphiplicatus metriothermophilus TaxID=1519374 RepID=A0A239PSI5_9PROT|nr:ImmA/IrrE family metallo-endopeptidase [Amphiplicatus metriothermophilus]MBB5519165.1 Zn-dependent peptidase ImmA (M78 family)/transcriptional regulator with XRE-family HTH domain [Amphiplicatus metriothermophilus]SNT73235.1 Zn-dependent peptidase ImmA, M78 family [Amphiplicatus metriothermophilus]
MARAKTVIGVQASILRWARETANLSIGDVAKRLKKPEAVIEAWEAGEKSPTYPQLERLAYDLYKRPLALFFLPAPPDEPRAQTEFRSLPTDDLLSLDRDTIFLIRRARAFRFALEELYAKHSPVERPIWKEIVLSEASPLESQAQAIRSSLGVSLEEQRDWPSPDHALKEWRRAIEARGVFVFKHAFKQRDISGFCLVDDEFPLIMVNNSTTKTRQIFSLLHELAHVLFHRSGISVFDDIRIESLPAQDRAIEKFCNAIAAEILVPLQDFRVATARWAPQAASDEQYEELAKRYHVSRAVILRRFLDEGRVTRQFYRRKAEEWDSQRSQSAGEGGNYYATQGAYLSETFVREVFSRYAKRLLSRDEAAELIGVAPKNLSKLEDQILKGAQAA